MKDSIVIYIVAAVPFRFRVQCRQALVAIAHPDPKGTAGSVILTF